ncbi:MAG TPA: 30S ribosomal protein S17 [Patescibacteria group bacterium]|nr:30S ribosomal protein S17 [Patescibacteria group bacterium]
MTEKKKEILRQLTGTVIGDKLDKTVVVEVERVLMHEKYKKQYKYSKKYKAHDEKNEYKKGDKVLIRQCRPMSRDKRWRVIKKVK